MIMKKLQFLYFLFFSAAAFAQPHGHIYGSKPDTTGTIKAVNLEKFMDKKTRISTTISGKVLKVTKEKGGWFTIDGGNGKIISAHFTDYKVNVPMGLAGKSIIAEGIAEKQFIADDQQHFAGDTARGKKEHTTKTNPKNSLTFEVKGLMVAN